MGVAPEGFSAVLLNTAVNSFLLLAPVTALLLLCRKGSGATRHFTWLAALGSLFLLPAADHIWLPVQRPAWAGGDNPVTNWVIQLTYAAPEKSAASRTVAAAPMARHGGEGSSRLSEPASAAPTAISANQRFDRWLQILWVGGVLAALLAMGRGLATRAWLARQAEPLNDPACLEMARQEQAALGVRRPVRILLSPQPVMPMTWGVAHPVILLPREAVAWPASELRLVLRHELAHVHRWDCLTQGLARFLCAWFWFNPLVWLAARQMRLERERACDELVVGCGARPSEYAGCLLEMARRFARAPRVAAIAMARPANLERRLRAIVASGFRPARLHPLTAAVIALLFAAGTLFFFGPSATALDATGLPKLAAVRQFVEAKRQQAAALAKAEGAPLSAEMEAFFAAGMRGEWQEFTNDFFHLQKARQGGRFQNATWATAVECLGYYELWTTMEPEYLKEFGHDTLAAIPPGSLYFGGTDPGRFIITAMSKSHADADPFFTLTQNALADGTYLEYLRRMYGARLYIPTEADASKCFQEYLAGAQRRAQNQQLKPGEDVRIVDNRVQVSGQVAVMEINALLAKVIFDRNPKHEFYLEESFPLDWMYPHLSPHGLILKVNREPLAELPAETMQRDREYWQQRCNKMIGPWLREDTPVKTVAEFARRVYGDKNLEGFQGDTRFVRNPGASNLYGKLRSAIAGVYAWRLSNRPPEGAKKRLAEAADFAFRQAVALCPTNPEAVSRYVKLLETQKRFEEANLLAQTAAAIAEQQKDSAARQFTDLVQQLKKQQSESANPAGKAGER